MNVFFFKIADFVPEYLDSNLNMYFRLTQVFLFVVATASH